MTSDLNIGWWDAALRIAASLQATGIAYIHHPRGKALLYALPFPFTLACLALHRPIGATHAFGVTLLPFYPNAIRWLSERHQVPIVLSILLAALTYAGLSASLVRVIPVTDMAFWLGLAVATAVGWTLHLWLPHRQEPGHISPLPVPVKLVIVAVVVSCIVLAKNTLQGFMTCFPIVGVAGAYEARHSLWTFGRQVPVLVIAIVPLLAVCRLTQGSIGLGRALALGWIAFLIVLGWLTRRMWREADRELAER